MLPFLWLLRRPRNIACCWLFSLDPAGRGDALHHTPGLLALTATHCGYGLGASHCCIPPAPHRTLRDAATLPSPPAVAPLPAARSLPPTARFCLRMPYSSKRQTHPSGVGKWLRDVLRLRRGQRRFVIPYVAPLIGGGTPSPFGAGADAQRAGFRLASGELPHFFWWRASVLLRCCRAALVPLPGDY